MLVIKMMIVIIVIVVFGVVKTILLLLYFFYFINFILFWQSILAEGDICGSQRRASSEGLGLLARLGNDIFTARMVSSRV